MALGICKHRCVTAIKLHHRKLRLSIASFLSCSVFRMCGQSKDGKQRIAMKDVPFQCSQTAFLGYDLEQKAFFYLLLCLDSQTRAGLIFIFFFNYDYFFIICT